MPFHVFESSDLPFFKNAMAEMSHDALDNLDLMLKTRTRKQNKRPSEQENSRPNRVAMMLDLVEKVKDSDALLVQLVNTLFYEFGTPGSRELPGFKKLQSRVFDRPGVYFEEYGFRLEPPESPSVPDSAKVLGPVGITNDFAEFMNSFDARKEESERRKREARAEATAARAAAAREQPVQPADPVPTTTTYDLVPAERKRPNKVFIVHGQDMRPVNAMRTFLHFLGLPAISWEEARDAVGTGTPNTFDVVLKGMSQAGAVVVLFSPDEEVALRPELSPKSKSGEPQRSQIGYQARPNVFLEAGLAYASDPKGTIFVQSSSGMRSVSDIQGFNNIRMDGSWGQRKALMQALQRLGLSAKPAGDDLKDDLAGPFQVDEWD